MALMDKKKQKEEESIERISRSLSVGVEITRSMISDELPDLGKTLYAATGSVVKLNTGLTVDVPTGIKLFIPAGYYGLLGLTQEMRDLDLILRENIVDNSDEIVLKFRNIGIYLRDIEKSQPVATVMIVPKADVTFDLQPPKAE